MTLVTPTTYHRTSLPRTNDRGLRLGTMKRNFPSRTVFNRMSRHRFRRRHLSRRHLSRHRLSRTIRAGRQRSWGPTDIGSRETWIFRAMTREEP